VPRQVFGLVGAVLLTMAEFDEAPERVWHLDPAVPALPDQGRVGLARVFERFVFGIEIVAVA
jgi:hypothetical protein